MQSISSGPSVKPGRLICTILNALKLLIQSCLFPTSLLARSVRLNQGERNRKKLELYTKFQEIYEK
jgi:hypothetical protein